MPPRRPIFAHMLLLASTACKDDPAEEERIDSGLPADQPAAEFMSTEVSELCEAVDAYFL